MRQEKILYEIPKMDLIKFEDRVLTDIVQASNLGDISETQSSNYGQFFEGY